MEMKWIHIQECQYVFFFHGFAEETAWIEVLAFISDFSSDSVATAFLEKEYEDSLEERMNQIKDV